MIKTKDRRKVIEKSEYTKHFFEIFNSEENTNFWKERESKRESTIDIEREKRREQKNKWAQRKELTTIHLIKKVKKEYKINYKGIINHILEIKNDYTLINKRYVIVQEVLKRYFYYLCDKDLNDASIKDLLESFIFSFISTLIKYYGSLKKVEEYEGLRVISEQYIFRYGIKPHIILDIYSEKFWLKELELI